MEHKINEVFDFKGINLKVVKSKNCKRCYFDPESCALIKPDFCTSDYREDKKEIIFVKQIKL